MPRKKKDTANAYNALFPKRLRQLIEQNDTNQQRLSEYLDISHQAVSNYCAGVSSPDWEGLSKIADYFCVSVDYLIGRTAVKMVNTDLRAVCEYTGLTQESILKLSTATAVGTEEDKIRAEFLSFLINSKHLTELIDEIRLAKAYEITGGKLQRWNGRDINMRDLQEFIVNQVIREIIASYDSEYPYEV